VYTGSRHIPAGYSVPTCTRIESCCMHNLRRREFGEKIFSYCISRVINDE
jgi:hypothetical protein